jgi:hypothetical protein
MDLLKKCTKCGDLKPRTAFYAHRGWKDGLYPYCKACTLEVQRVAYARREAGVQRRYRWNRNKARHDYFAHVATQTQAYVLGVLAADGNILGAYNRITLELSTKDRSLLEFVRDELAPGGTYTTRSRSGRTYDVFTFTSPQMVADLAIYGVVPAKSRILRWPDRLERGLAREFILGFFDGDGFITGGITRTGGKDYRYHYIGLCSGSSEFLLDLLQVIADATGVRMGGPWRNGETRCFTIRTSGESARVVDAWLHSDDLGLRRKRLSGKDA